MTKYKKAPKYLGKDLIVNLGRADLRLDDGILYDNPKLARFVSLGMVVAVVEEAAPAAVPHLSLEGGELPLTVDGDGKHGFDQYRTGERPESRLPPKPVAAIHEAKTVAPSPPATPVVEEKKEPVVRYTESELAKNNKAALADLAATMGLDLDTSTVTKAQMIEAILEKQGE